MRNTSFIKVTNTSSVFSASVWALTPRCVWGCLHEKERCVQSVLIPWALITGFFDQNSSNQGFPSGTSGKKAACQRRRLGFDPWVRKIPWRRAWQTTPIFLPGESPRTAEPGGLQSMGSQRVGHDWAPDHRHIQASICTTNKHAPSYLLSKSIQAPILFIYSQCIYDLLIREEGSQNYSEPPKCSQVVKNLPANAGDVEMWVWSLDWEDLLEEGMATHSNILAWRIPKDRGAWRAPVHGVSKSWTLSHLARTARMHQRLESEIKAWGWLLSIWLRWSLHIMHHFKV